MEAEEQVKINPISKSLYSKEGLIEKLNEFRARYNRYPTRVSGNGKGAKYGNGGSGKKEQNAEFSVSDHS